MAKKRKQILTEKPPPNLTTITRKSKRRRKPKVNSNLIQITQHNMNLRPKKQSVLLGMPNERSVTCAKDKNYGLNIEVTCSPSNNNTINSKARRKRKKKRDRTILTIGESTMFKTIDVARADDDANSDVVFVDNGEDEVIYVADDSTKQDLESPNGEESVIVIDDDSNVENVTNTNQILAGANMNKPLTKTPTIYDTYVRCKDGLLRPSRLNHLRIGNNNHGNKKCNVPNLSPIPVVNRQQARIPELPTLATSTPARDLASPGYSVPNLMDSIANIQIMQPVMSMTTQRPTQQLENMHNEISNNFEIFGSNYVNVGPIRTTGLRPVFIDGSNIAMSHRNGRCFSVEGLKICIDYFKFRGHEVTAIVPTFRKKASQCSNPKLLQKLEKAGNVVFTPSRTVNGRHIVPYDDRYIVLLAHVHQGIIVSADNYRDLLHENPSLLDTIENRVLTPTWLRDMLIFPADPMGRNGPQLEEFLRFP